MFIIMLLSIVTTVTGSWESRIIVLVGDIHLNVNFINESNN